MSTSKRPGRKARVLSGFHKVYGDDVTSFPALTKANIQTVVNRGSEVSTSTTYYLGVAETPSNTWFRISDGTNTLQFEISASLENASSSLSGSVYKIGTTGDSAVWADDILPKIKEGMNEAFVSGVIDGTSSSAEWVTFDAWDGAYMPAGSYFSFATEGTYTIDGFDGFGFKPTKVDVSTTQPNDA
jgi:hypothetical protein